ncbi:MAG: xylulose kinase, partial [Clostridiaceae bacterium]|nr:xylulose kinase [Clostridiaceae bacterium]
MEKRREMYMALLGLDIGTTGTKATIFDEDGNILSHAYGEYDIHSDGEGLYEIDPLLVWNTAKNIISQANKQAGNPGIEALCTSSLGEAFVMLDHSGKELAKSPIYMDKRGEVECSDLVRALGAEEIMSITGHPPHSMYSICKLMWLYRNNPRLYKKVNKILFYGDYVLHKLGGRYIADYSLAARSMCFDIKNKQWSEKIIEHAGLDLDIFPETKAT